MTSSGISEADIGHMRTALTLARRGLGQVWPNPAVGCVVTGPDGRIVGRGWTAPGGRPHGEAEALARAGERARGGTAYVTLEPCDHQGQTPPCSIGLIAAGIRRCVVATGDPDPRVDGQGIRRLKDAGIEVVQGLLEDEALEINAGFFLRVRSGRPLFTFKAATSLDGRIATRTGDSRWITGSEARARGHMLRARHDAILVGIGTALADDPSLTCRLPGMDQYSPIRIIADSRLRLPASSMVVRTARAHPTWIVHAPGADKDNAKKLKAQGVELVEVANDASGRAKIPDMAEVLGKRGLTRVLIEGGGKLAGGFLAAGLLDRLAWFHAPILIGGEGVPAIAGPGMENLPDCPHFERLTLEQIGPDLYETYRPIEKGAK